MEQTEEVVRQFREAVTHPTFWKEVLDNADAVCLAGAVIVDANTLAQGPGRREELLRAKLQNLRRSLSERIPPVAAALLRDWVAYVEEPQPMDPEKGLAGGFTVGVRFYPPPKG